MIGRNELRKWVIGELTMNIIIFVSFGQFAFSLYADKLEICSRSMYNLHFEIAIL